MPGIQEPILANTTLGRTPLLLISFDETDGVYLSVLLSFHLRPPDHHHDKPVSRHNNYFSNHTIRHLINTYQLSPKNDISAALKLALEEGFDTRSLYGLSLPVSVLQYLNIERDFNDAEFTYVYNDLITRDAEDKEEKSEYHAIFVKKLIAQYPLKSHIINARYLISSPELVLKYMAEQCKAGMIKTEMLLPHSALPAGLLFDKKERILHDADKSFFIERDRLRHYANAKAGSEFMFVFLFNDPQQEKILIEKLNQLVATFPEQIKVLLLCKSEKQTIYAQMLFATADTKLIDAEIMELHQSLADTFNDIPAKTNAKYISIDFLNTRYDYAKYIQLLQAQKSQIAFPATAAGEDAQEISLNELLTNSIPESGLLFDTNMLENSLRFDNTLPPEYILWDFCISAADTLKAKCIAIPAHIVATKKPGHRKVQEPFNKGYKRVIQKHHALITQSLDEIIEQISSSSISGIQQSKQLNEQIASLQVILLHSKEELKSFQQLTAQLHHRIHHLENNWYHKLKTKVIRIKKIFFKKKAPGSGTIKRILQFMRFALSRAGFGIFRKILKNVLKKVYLMAENRPVQILYLDESNHDHIYTYDDWIKNKLDEDRQFEYYEEALKKLSATPLVSIIMPVYNTPLKYLKEAVESVLTQNYPHWELCIADDNSSENKVKKILHTYSVKEPRIQIVYRAENGHISAASNSALAIAKGEYILLLDHDDLLTSNCLAEVALAIDKNPEADILYSDEDKIDERRIHQSPHFKPDWAPDHLLSRNYIGHVAVIRKSLMDKIEGFRIGFEGSQDYDLLLRATELTTKIIHIPKVLYHWRIHTLSASHGEDVKPYAYIAAKKALNEALQRRGLQGDVKYLSGLRGYKIEYKVVSEEKVSIIIPTKDQTELLKNTVESIIEKTSYKNYEIIILNNNSTTKQLSDYLAECSKKYHGIIRCIDAHFPFNFSKLMNTGATHAGGKYYLLLNNDVEVIHDDWLETMVSYAQQERIGAVGVKLLYPDDTIQHAGVIVGLGGIAGHTFVGAYKDEAGYFNYIQSVNNYSAVTAACLMVSREAFEKVNGMDEAFEVEYNDVDFCLKLSEAGFYNVYLPQVELYHYESATRGHPHQSNVSYERHLREMKLFKEKWQNIIDHDPFYNPNLNLGVHDFSMNFSA